MTAASKTERQLIDSIRKAKTGGDDAPAAQPGVAAQTAASVPPAEQARGPEPQPPADQTSADQTSAGICGYGNARRVWPD